MYGGRREVHTEFWWRNVKERDCFGELGVDGRSVLKWVINKLEGRLWTGLIRLKLGTSGEPLWTH
jgi:hypothetical protein